MNEDDQASVETGAEAIARYAIGRLLARQARIEEAVGTWGLFSILHRPGRYFAWREHLLSDQLGKADRAPNLTGLPALAWGAGSGRWRPHAAGLFGLAIVGAPSLLDEGAMCACAVFDGHHHGHLLTTGTGHLAPVREADCRIGSGLRLLRAALPESPSAGRRCVPASLEPPPRQEN